MRAVMIKGKPYTEEHWHYLELNVRLVEIGTFFTMYANVNKNNQNNHR